MSELAQNQVNYRRSLAVTRAWDNERELVRRGRGTRNWSVKEQKELLDTGRVKGYQGHHMKSVSRYPEHMSDPKNIQFLDARKGNNEHLKAHKGDYHNESNSRYNVNTGKSRPMADGKPRAMNSYELNDKAIDRRAYAKYDASKQANVPSKGERTSSSKPARTEYNGKTYSRAYVKQNTGEKKSAQEQAPKRAEAQSKPSETRYAARAKSSSANSSADQGDTNRYAKAVSNKHAQAPSKKSGESNGQQAGNYASRVSAKSTQSSGEKGGGQSHGSSGQSHGSSGQPHGSSGQSHGSSGQHR